MEWVVSLLKIAGGLWLLVWGAGRFVDGAAAVARLLGVPALVVGIVIVGFGTSAPEIIVSTLASLQGNLGLALGNAYGSNIANIAVILGVTAIVTPLTVQSRIVQREIPILLAVTLLAIGLFLDGEFSRTDSVILLVAFAGLVLWMVREALHCSDPSYTVDPIPAEHQFLKSVPEPAEAPRSRRKELVRLVVWIVVGLVLMIVGSQLLVDGAIEIAHRFGVSDLIIGLTIVALGTSLPELASSITAARRGEHDLVMGNLIGSNLFNTLAVVGVVGMIHPFPVEREFLYRDGAMTVGLTVVLFLVCYPFARFIRGSSQGLRHRLGTVHRVEGILLLAVWIMYVGWLIHCSVNGSS